MSCATVEGVLLAQAFSPRHSIGLIVAENPPPRPPPHRGTACMQNGRVEPGADLYPHPPMIKVCRTLGKVLVRLGRLIHGRRPFSFLDLRQ